MIDLYPLTFQPNVQTALWGTESWEISGRAHAPSVVAEGPLAGRTLDDLTRVYGAALVGTKPCLKHEFPLLIKVIDAKKRLSVQVHPNERSQALTGGEPKTEMWRVLGGSGPIFAGLKPGVSPTCVEEAVKTNRLENLLVRHPAHEGLTLLIPGGLVHALGEDVLVYEVQQSSETTFRLSDWGRVDANGQPRPLHVAQALKAIDFDLPVPSPCEEVQTPFFHVRAVEVSGTLTIPARLDTVTALYFVSTHQSVLVPASCAATFSHTGTVLITTR